VFAVRGMCVTSVVPFVGAGVVGVVGHVRGWWGVGHSSPLKGGGGGPLLLFAGGGDVLLLGHRHCGWGPSLSLGGYDAGPTAAVEVGPHLLRCPSLFSLRCPSPFSCRFAEMSFRHVVISPRRRCVVSSMRGVDDARRLHRPSSPSGTPSTVVVRR
jgi:hypothetical protein